MDYLSDKVLGQKFATDIILMIHDKGEVMLSDLDRGNWTTTSKRLKELESAGLIQYRMRTSGRMVPLWSLTETGAAVAVHLIAIEKILESSDDVNEPVQNDRS